MRNVIYLISFIYSCNLMAEQKIVIIGAGTVTCSQFLETVHNGKIEDDNPARIGFVSWAQGCFRKKQTA